VDYVVIKHLLEALCSSTSGSLGRKKGEARRLWVFNVGLGIFGTITERNVRFANTISIIPWDFMRLHAMRIVTPEAFTGLF
jgi:hypothetical protein